MENPVTWARLYDRLVCDYSSEVVFDQYERLLKAYYLGSGASVPLAVYEDEEPCPDLVLLFFDYSRGDLA